MQLECVAVSRRHAEVFDDGSRFALRDLDSRNGTYVNGRRIAHAIIADGDVVRMGGWVGLFRCLVSDEPPGGLQTLGPGLLGGCEFAQRVAPLRATAASREPISLVGEAGTGKESVARAIHAWSRRQGLFRVVNCAALPEYLAERELFGYAVDSQRGSERTRGHVSAAEGGTLLLDDVDELPPSVQIKLLHLLTTGELRPADGDSPGAVDVRLIVTTQRPLRTAAATGNFRKELSDILTKHSLRLPPLRQRIPEIPELFNHFVRQRSKREPFGVESRLVEALCIYSWPGNLRELESVASHLVAVHHEASQVCWDNLPQRIRAAAGKLRSDAPSKPPDVETTRPTLEEPLELPGGLPRRKRRARVSGPKAR